MHSTYSEKDEELLVGKQLGVPTIEMLWFHLVEASKERTSKEERVKKKEIQYSTHFGMGIWQRVGFVHVEFETQTSKWRWQYAVGAGGQELKRWFSI